jgi:hypothetical protein
MNALTDSERQHNLDGVLWKLRTSLECTAVWLENGGDPKQAAAELRLNIDMLNEATRHD